MKITKTPILDSDNQGIVGFEITLSGYFFNRNKAIDKQDKLANQEAELEYEINEKINNQDDSPKEKEALKILQNHLKELTTEREKIEKEIEDAYNKVDEIDNNFDDYNPYNYVDCDSSSLSYATSLITDASFAIKEPEEFEATPPYVDITIKSFISSVNLYFSSSASYEDSHDNLLRFYTEHTLYGEVKKYGVSISCNNSESYSFFSKLCEWVRMDGEVDYVDDDLGHWGMIKLILLDSHSSL
ncbi:hypothetical protein [Rosenbergiella epipactidis]|uniref:hypothetical protein n=1 Tax=Rosenbergiella epipactidis TaxID=1544694 RepID=UPI001F4D51C7|nr:hypothetical protein [Rosenbergiella epipactidis]